MKIPGVMVMLAGVFLGCSVGAADMDLKKYPMPEEGRVMQVIELPKVEGEDEKKVQILVGKFAMVDSANRAWMQGQMEAKDLKGWGYPYYVFTSNGRIMQTRRGGGEPERRFVNALSDYTVRYNSKLPLVVYVPEGFSVKYRVWTLGEEEIHAKEISRKDLK